MTECTKEKINPECKSRFDDIEHGLKQILENQKEFKDAQDDLHNRMFVDNGVESFQTFRRKTESFIKASLWLFCLVCSGVILATIGVAIKNIFT